MLAGKVPFRIQATTKLRGHISHQLTTVDHSTVDLVIRQCRRERRRASEWIAKLVRAFATVSSVAIARLC
jgi:Leu/Phe-tRNA-protein transferase